MKAISAKETQEVRHATATGGATGTNLPGVSALGPIMLALAMAAASLFCWGVLSAERMSFVGIGIGRWVPEAILSFGLIMAALLPFAAYLARRQRHSAAALETSNRRVEAERQRLRDVMNMLPAYVILLSPDYRVPFANRYFEEHFGKSEGRRCYEYLFHRDAPCENCETFKVLSTHAPHHWEWTGPNGRNYDIHDFPFTDVDGAPLIMEMGADITERKRAEARLQRVNAALRTVSECTQAIAHAETETELLQRVCEIAVASGSYPLAWIGFAENDELKSVRVVAKAGIGTEYVTDESVTWADEPHGRGPTGQCIRSRKPVCCCDVQTDACFAPWRERALQSGLGCALSVPLLRRNEAFGALAIYAGEPHAFGEDEVALFSQFAGDVAFAIDALRTREARRRAEEELHRSLQRLRLHVQQTPLGVVEWDTEFRIVEWNPRAEKLFGYTREEALGRHAWFLVPEHDRSPIAGVWAALLAARGGRRSTNENVCKDGSRLTCEWYNTPLVDESGSVIGVASLVEDITERKRAQDELALTAEQLQRSNTELQEFAFVASHDLQEPLRKITAFSERLRDHCGAQLDETGLDYMQRMRGAALRMGRLIDSLLEYSRVSTRALPFEDVDLAQVMVGVLADVEQRIRESGARVVVGVLPRVEGDPTQLRQLLQNLLSNALKFHAAGAQPMVAVNAKKADGRWEISVADNGIGFDAAFTDRIFTPFQRLHGRNEFEGSGMGLAICRKIAQRHGAEIHVHSQPGQGATFTVFLPILERSESCPENPSASCSPKTTTTIFS